MPAVTRSTPQSEKHKETKAQGEKRKIKRQRKVSVSIQ